MLTCPKCLHAFRDPCCTKANGGDHEDHASRNCVPGHHHATQQTHLTVTPSTQRLLTGGGLLEPTWLTLTPPTTPLATVTISLPGLATAAVTLQAPILQNTHLYNAEGDINALNHARTALTASYWYIEGITWNDAAQLLSGCSPGAFLVRDSSDPRFLYSLSVQTPRGPTSVRIHYYAGCFRLDAEPHLTPLMPRFATVNALVAHYVRDANPTQVWVDSDGRTYSAIQLVKPVYKNNKPPPLKHLARVAFNRARITQKNSCQLPPAITRYLAAYPYEQ